MEDRMQIDSLGTRLLLFVTLAVFVWSAIHPHDRFTWFLEVAPALIAFPVMALTWKSFRLTDLLYIGIALHAMILMVGGHYTYAEVPLFNWIRDHYGLARNHYDRLGHLAQGFFPALVAREILIRKHIVKRGAWLFFVVVCICLALSASYELIEWAVAEMSGDDAVAFLATQGDVWDTQKDMAMALLGSILAQVLLFKLHDRQLKERME
jgi:putative membrane protein